MRSTEVYVQGEDSVGLGVTHAVEPIRYRWRTPESVLSMIEALLGVQRDLWLDLANEIDNPTRAAGFFTYADPCPINAEGEKIVEAIDARRGQAVFCNPPFDRISRWAYVWNIATRLRGRGALITPCGLETAWARMLADAGARGLVPRGRIAYEPPPGVKASTPRMPTMIWVAGNVPVAAYDRFDLLRVTR